MIVVPGPCSSVTSFASLLRSLRQQVTVHGLQPRGANGTSVPHRTVQAAAAVYLRAIRQVQPSGPYRLAGHSFGGWIVFELACRLSAEGETIAPIVLIDTEPPTLAGAAPRHRGRVATLMKLIGLLEEGGRRSMNLTREELEVLDYESQLARLTEGMKAMEALPRNSDVNDIRGLVRVFEVHLNTSYVPAARFPGRAVLLQPEERSGGIGDEKPRGPAEISEAWRGYVGHLECASVPGGHMSMLNKPQVELIAGHMSRVWASARGKRWDRYATMLSAAGPHARSVLSGRKHSSF